MARKITATLFAAQSFGSAAFIAGGTVSAIVGAQLSGNPALAGLPAAVQQSGTAVAALLLGALMERVGRRWGLVLGFVIGMIGAALAVAAIMTSSFLLFLAGLGLFGVAHAAVHLGRFAAAEVHRTESRGRAISYVVVGGTVGAVVGPLIVGPSGTWASSVDMDELAGPYVAAVALIALVALVIFFWLRPDPRDIGREIAEAYPESAAQEGSRRSIRRILTSPSAFVAVATMVVGQAVMVLVMGMTSLHMRGNSHPLGSISIVMSAHTLGMFAFSILSGRLADKWGRAPLMLTGAGILVLGCTMAAASTSLQPLSIALFLVGLGWNLCYVGGSALLSDQLTPAERSRTQGVNDLLIFVSTAGVSAGSGLLFATIGYAGIGIAGAGTALALGVLISRWIVRRRIVI